MSRFQVTVILTSDLVSRIESGAYFLFSFEVGINKFGVCMHLLMVICHVPFLGHCDLDFCPSF